MPQVVVDIHVVPIGTATASISDYVSACETVLKDFRSVKYSINPLSTTLEGELHEVLEVVRRMHEAPFNQGAQRVVTSIRIDDRRDQLSSMQHKVAVVQEKSGLGA